MQVVTWVQSNSKLAVALALGLAILTLVWWGPTWLVVSVAAASGIVLLGELSYFAARYARTNRAWLLVGGLAIVILSGSWGLTSTTLLYHGNWKVFLVVLTIVATDASAQFIGQRYGTPGTFWATASPGKSRHGVYGGVLVGTLFALITVAIWWMIDGSVYLPVATVLLMAPVLAVAGDIFESLVKRSLGIKDFGRLLGRETGGLLDRLDSWLFVFTLLGFTLFILN